MHRTCKLFINRGRQKQSSGQTPDLEGQYAMVAFADRGEKSAAGCLPNIFSLHGQSPSGRDSARCAGGEVHAVSLR